MKKIFRYGLYGGCLWAVVWTASCGEDELASSEENRTDMFMPSPEAEDSTSALRREFREKTGCYLLFNDTLRHDLLGYDYNGEPVYFTELVDIAYELGTSTGSRAMYRYTLLSEMDGRKAAVGFVEDYVLAHFKESLRPFSWLLVSRIEGRPVGSLTSVYPDAVSGQRCVAVACNYILADRTEEELELYATRVINVFLFDLVEARAEEFEEFRRVSRDYYGGTFTSSGSADNMRQLYEAGFLARGHGSFGEADGYYPDFDKDLSSYVTYVLNLDEETMERSFGQYPLVMQKYRLMREKLEELGFIF